MLVKSKADAVTEVLNHTRLLPLYTPHDLDRLPDLEAVLLACGLPIIEITLRSSSALAAITYLAKRQQLIVGAGTVRTLAQAQAAVAAGATFLVSPAIIPEVVDYAKQQQISIYPGVATPSEIQIAVDHGISTVKFFPAHLYGGLEAIQSLRGPFYDVSFIPTGGIDQTNYLDYLQTDGVVAVGGSFIISDKVLATPDHGEYYLSTLLKQIHKP
ncbi:bifunctional 4-hydroxy-2-oxoglutarate aldolase/2-dehydro-3-deoxy-phosphogluconate aldolase [uncultured Enterococcus sp.]|uniref:bifunctional 4-hydroxy-2-oxoglutarate aldolase/2-dehydro-3-deoxy-phosphogluconate aldolase n=1 Tax=uncultured Enterococcus sp. TaxID=167972 RepID=UPI0025CBCA4B|nr:bifunctional 4-hydroxy-2-oxoglutarate aldolase/2-dehydro-3-deoxy-phosphogluconate aldolase [uncultured Enterococcus sp.]